MSSPTVARHHLVKKSDGPDIFMPHDPNVSSPTDLNAIVAESLIFWDTNAGSSGFIKPLTNDTNAQYFSGVCMDQVPANYGSIVNPNGVSPNGPRNTARVSRAGQATLKATGGDAIVPNGVFYAGADEQTMTTTPGTYPLGYIDPKQPAVASATAGQLILCRFRARYQATYAS